MKLHPTRRSLVTEIDHIFYTRLAAWRNCLGGAIFPALWGRLTEVLGRFKGRR